MDPARVREVASKGGLAAHAKGTAHEWTREEARAAGQKGGQTSARQATARQRAQPQPRPPVPFNPLVEL